MLRRHGLTVHFHGVDEPDGDAGEVLLAQAAAHAADLLVMGAYGHTRLREMVFGGATRHVLRETTLPVLFGNWPRTARPGCTGQEPASGCARLPSRGLAPLRCRARGPGAHRLVRDRGGGGWALPCCSISRFFAPASGRHRPGSIDVSALIAMRRHLPDRFGSCTWTAMKLAAQVSGWTATAQERRTAFRRG